MVVVLISPYLYLQVVFSINCLLTIFGLLISNFSAIYHLFCAIPLFFFLTVILYNLGTFYHLIILTYLLIWSSIFIEKYLIVWHISLLSLFVLFSCSSSPRFVNTYNPVLFISSTSLSHFFTFSSVFNLLFPLALFFHSNILPRWYSNFLLGFCCVLFFVPWLSYWIIPWHCFVLSLCTVRWHCLLVPSHYTVFYHCLFSLFLCSFLPL